MALVENLTIKFSQDWGEMGRPAIPNEKPVRRAAPITPYPTPRKIPAHPEPVITPREPVPAGR